MCGKPYEFCGNIYELCGKDWLNSVKHLWNIFGLYRKSYEITCTFYSFCGKPYESCGNPCETCGPPYELCGKTYDSCGTCLWTSYEMYGRFLWILWRNIWILWKSYDLLSKVNEIHIHFVDFSNMSTENWDLAASGFLQDFNLLLWISPSKINVKPLHDVNAQRICIKDH